MWGELLVAIIIGFLLFYLIACYRSLKDKKLHGIYTQPDSKLIYWVKWCMWCVHIWIEQKRRIPRLNNYDWSATASFETCGVTSTPSEQEIESTKHLTTHRHEDSVLIWGSDKEGRTLYVQIIRKTERRATVVFVVKDKKGQIFCLPNHPDTRIINTDGKGWSGNGVLLECVEPMRTWRVKFCGALRVGERRQYITDDDDDTSTDDIIHARFDFLWRALKAPIDVWKQSSPLLLAHALARETDSNIGFFTSLDRDGYDQWGTLSGEVRICEHPVEVWHLRGTRQRRWGMSESTINFHRSVDVMSFFENGDVAWLQAFSFTSGITHGTFGYVVTAAGRYMPVKSTSLFLPEIGENGNIPQNLIIKFRAGSRDYEMWHKLDEGLRYCTGDPWTLCHDLRMNYAASNYGHGWGLTIFTKRFLGLCPVPERESFPELVVPEVDLEDPSTPLVLSLDNALCRNSQLVGGKGSGLAFLRHFQATKVIEEEFVVPSGIVVTVAGWNAHLSVVPELQLILRSFTKAVGSGETRQIQESCKKFAVRSSAYGEDDASTSAAGQNQTFLGCRGKKELEEAIISCWASQFTFQSVEYRRQRGQYVNTGMAVVVQEMVAADIAGVIFSHHPVNGNPSLMVLTANYGLGESVVSSISDPDSIVIKRSWRDQLWLMEKTLGKKELMSVMDDIRDSGRASIINLGRLLLEFASSDNCINRYSAESGLACLLTLQDTLGTNEVKVENEKKSSYCISDTIALSIARITVFLEHSFGFPVDVEFAVQNNVIYLVQSRAITNLKMWTDFELTHEQDGAVLSDYELFTKANTGEVFPGHTTPLTISVVARTLDLAIQRDFIVRDWPNFNFDPCHIRMISVSHNHCLLNVFETCYRGIEEQVSASNLAIDLAIFGHFVTTPEIHSVAVQRYGVMSAFERVYRLCYAIHKLFFSSNKIENLEEFTQTYQIDLEKNHSSLSLYKEISRKIPEFFKVFQAHVDTSSTSSITQCIALIILSENKKGFSDDNIMDMASLLQSCCGVESADVPHAIKDLAKVIGESEESDDFLAMTFDEGKIWLKSHPGEIGWAFRDFLRRHGHRCIKEFDLSSHSWASDAKALIDTLQTMVRGPGSLTVAKTEVGLEEVISNLKSTLKPSTKKLGQLMMSEGRMPETELIFFLQHYEIGQLLSASCSPELVAKAVRRKKLQPYLESLQFPELIRGVPEPLSSAEIETFEKSAVLTGTAVCQGIAKGEARVVTNLEDATNIRTGNILVTYSTDVGWTPYFPLLSGVITEIGGLISHGAVVAREYGLPCIVGVTNATRLLKSGDFIILDGTRGEIRRLDTRLT